MIKRSKRPFLLLEALIALTMIGLSAGFFLRVPTATYHKHLVELENLELALQANHLFIQVQQHLKKRHSWDSLKKKESTNFMPLEDFVISYNPLIEKTYKVAYTLNVSREKESQDLTQYKLLNCTIYFVPEKSFTSWHKVSKETSPCFCYKIFTSFSPQKS